jgi:hypothetical protein
MCKIKLLLKKIFGLNKTQSQDDIWKVVPDNYESEFYKKNPNGKIFKIPLN